MWGVLAVDALVREDQSLKTSLVRQVSNYARIIIASQTLLPSHPIWKLDGQTNWSLEHEWIFGGEGVVYDLLYGDLTQDQRTVIRKAISLALDGRHSWGTGNPKTKVFSN